MTPRDAVDIIARLDDETSRDLAAWLNRPDGGPPAPAHREVVNGRWVVFLTHNAQTYCLLPLSFSVSLPVGDGG